MFLCQRCDNLVGPRKKLHRVVSKRRDRNYVNVIGRDDQVASNGWEIVEEISVCDSCVGDMRNHDRTEVSAVSDLAVQMGNLLGFK